MQKCTEFYIQKCLLRNIKCQSYGTRYYTIFNEGNKFRLSSASLVVWMLILISGKLFVKEWICINIHILIANNVTYITITNN